MRPRVMIVGWDCAAPELVFNQWRGQLPNLERLMERGVHGPMRSTDPPITVPAWTSMMSSRNPGALGFYGFRNRRVGDYHGKWIATSAAVKVPRLWDLLSAVGKRVCVLNVPQTFPVKPVNGVMVSCFLTPGTDSNFVYPPELKDEIMALSGGYPVDIDNFRTEDKQWLLDEIYRLTDRQHTVALNLLQREPWDFFMYVSMGPDRLGHGFWKYCDPAHPQHEPGNCFSEAMTDYFRHLDRQLGELVAAAGPETTVMVVSDHGGKAMHGSLNINDWLIQKGYLVMKEPTAGVTRFDEKAVDWSRTRAWAWGGYYARVFINVQGREPEGQVAAESYEQFRDELIAGLQAIPDDQGQPMATRALRPQDLYSGGQVGEAPDLIVYFDDLYWRAGQDIGHETLYSFETEIGPDDSVHDYHGMFVMAPTPQPRPQPLDSLTLLEVAPTVLELLGVPRPPEMEGRPLL